MSRDDTIRRLKTASGHIDAVIRMLEDQRYYTDVLYQLHAVERAIVRSKRAVLDEHFHMCRRDPARGIDNDEFVDDLLDALYGGRPPRASRWYSTDGHRDRQGRQIRSTAAWPRAAGTNQ